MYIVAKTFFFYFGFLFFVRAAVGQPVTEKVVYYDRNGDSLIDREDHVFVDWDDGHDNYKLLDTDFDGLYDLIKYNSPWGPPEEKLDTPIRVPKDKTISEK